MTKPATSSEYSDDAGGDRRRRHAEALAPCRRCATGREATLNDMIAWPSAMAIIGTQEIFRCPLQDGLP